MKEEIWPLRFCPFLICAAVFLFLLPALAGCGRKESGAQDQEMADTALTQKRRSWKKKNWKMWAV